MRVGEAPDLQTLGMALPAVVKKFASAWFLHFRPLTKAFATTSAPAGLVCVWSLGKSAG